MGTFVRRPGIALVALLLVGCGSGPGVTSTSAGTSLATTTTGAAAVVTMTSASTTTRANTTTAVLTPTTAATIAPATTGPTVTASPDTGTWRHLAATSGGSRRFLAWTGTEAIVTAAPFAEPDADDQRLALRALDPVTGSWRLLPRSTVGESGDVAVWTGEELVVFTGDRGEAYSPVTNRWRSLRPPPVALTGRAWTWTGDRILVWGFEAPVGVEVPSDAEARALSYDPTRERWTTLPGAAVPGGVPWYGELAWTGHEVLATAVTTARGMHDGSDAYPGTRPLAYDPPTAAWRATAPYPFTVNISSMSAVIGRSQYWLHQIWDGPLSMFVYDAGTDEWATLTAPPGDGAIATFGSAGDRLFAMRGTSAALYDPATARWQPTSPPPTIADSGGARVVWLDGTILVVGQQSEMGGPDSVTYTPAR